MYVLLYTSSGALEVGADAVAKARRWVGGWWQKEFEMKSFVKVMGAEWG